MFFQALQFNVKVDHKRQKKIVRMFTIFLAIFPVILMTLFGSQMIKVETDTNLFFLSIVFGVISLFTMCFVFQFIIASLALRSRFQALNESFENFSNDEINFVETKVFESVKIGKLFDKLCDGIEIINETFTFQFIFIFTQLLVGFFFSVHRISINFNFFKVLLGFCFIRNSSILPGRKVNVKRTRGNGSLSNKIILRHHHYHIQSSDDRYHRSRRIAHNNTAEKTKVIVSKIVHQSLTNQDGKIEFILMMTQIQLRNVNLQNCFFAIDWRVLMAVSPISRAF